ncbi:hypothetical protein O181_060923 [Austropuccinia psidii MF-1]|uniref:Uncharacterized protein n=1 Tax=Austropuccinia psidii MF-1 TaxID=1389203 RepID=A0A9Q3EH89_9BASI|nr:hypothetical protein [Austropuccinia psidii MF-1]
MSGNKLIWKPLQQKLERDGTGSTKSMRNHLNALHHFINPKRMTSTSSTLDKFVQHHHPKKVLSMETLKSALVYFIAECNLPISLLESPSFHSLLKLCNPTVVNILVQKAALTAHLSNIFFFHQEQLQKSISLKGIFPSFTNNTWTSPNVREFISVTAHYVDQEFQLQSVLLVLMEIDGDHSGVLLANHFLAVIKQ